MSTHLLIILVYCFAQMETPNGVPYHPGRNAERGRWQLTPAVRTDRTRDLLAKHWKGMIDDQTLAAEQIIWIRERLIANGNPNPTPFDIGVAWNAGVTAKVRGTAPNKAYDYGARLAALVQDELDHEKH